MKPASPEEAVQRALRWVGRGVYGLGSGGYHAKTPDDPFTNSAGILKCDCSGYALWCYRLARHRPGFGQGGPVVDDINTDSMVWDSEHVNELFEAVESPRIGDLLCYPGIRGPDGRRIRIGHVGVIVGVPAEWDSADPAYGLCTVV